MSPRKKKPLAERPIAPAAGEPTAPLTCLVCNQPNATHAPDCRTLAYPVTFHEATDAEMAAEVDEELGPVSTADLAEAVGPLTEGAAEEILANIEAAPTPAPETDIPEDRGEPVAGGTLAADASASSDADPGDENDATAEVLQFPRLVETPPAPAPVDAAPAAAPQDQPLPLVGPALTAREGLTEIARHERRVESAFRAWDDLKEEAAAAKKSYDKEVETLRAVIRRVNATIEGAETQPALPLTMPAAAGARTPRGCPWEQAHPGKACPLCTKRGPGNEPAPRDLADHPEHPAHAEVAEDLAQTEAAQALATAEGMPEPEPVAEAPPAAELGTTVPAAEGESVVEQLRTLGVHATVAELEALSDEDLTALFAHLNAPGPIPPSVLMRCHVADRPERSVTTGGLVQTCRACSAQLGGEDTPTFYPQGALVGFSCTVAALYASVVAQQPDAEPVVEEPADA
jgi:hypothetical protein